MEWKFETGGDDLPDAYRWIPAKEEEEMWNTVAVYDVQKCKWMFQAIWGHVFGKAAAVNNFHEVKELIQAVARRWIMILLTFYFDDASLQDLQEAKGRGQRHFRALCRILGFPVAPKKQVDMTSEAYLIGLLHEAKYLHHQHESVRILRKV